MGLGCRLKENGMAALHGDHGGVGMGAGFHVTLGYQLGSLVGQFACGGIEQATVKARVVGFATHKFFVQIIKSHSGFALVATGI